MSKRQSTTPRKVTINKDILKKVQLRQSQRDYADKISNNSVIFCTGPAGTSKTFISCYSALNLLAEKKIKQIILCKPIQEAGEKLGFLPGDVNEKVGPYMTSYISNIEKIAGKEMTEHLLDTEKIVFRPLAYMRGDTFDDSLMILDEAQNAEWKQLILFITRMGKKSKVIISGDVSQYDIAKNKVSLNSFIELFQHVKGVCVHTFGNKDIVRAKILQDIVQIYDKWKHDNNL